VGTGGLGGSCPRGFFGGRGPCCLVGVGCSGCGRFGRRLGTGLGVRMGYWGGRGGGTFLLKARATPAPHEPLALQAWIRMLWGGVAKMSPGVSVMIAIVGWGGVEWWVWW